MEDLNLIEMHDGPVSFGTLVPLWLFNPRPKQMVGLPDYTPVLSCPVAEIEARDLLTDSTEAGFEFGYLQLDDNVLMTIRLQLNGAQFYWVAEMFDPTLWEAIDMWKRAGRVPVLFEVHEDEGRRVMFTAANMPMGALPIDVHRDGPGRAPTARTWHGIASVVESGLLQMRAKTNIPGIPLRHTFVNALLTKRLEQFFDEQPVVKNPMIARICH